MPSRKTLLENAKTKKVHGGAPTAEEERAFDNEQCKHLQRDYSSSEFSPSEEVIQQRSRLQRLENELFEVAKIEILNDSTLTRVAGNFSNALALPLGAEKLALFGKVIRDLWASCRRAQSRRGLVDAEISHLLKNIGTLQGEIETLRNMPDAIALRTEREQHMETKKQLTAKKGLVALLNSFAEHKGVTLSR